MKPIGYGAERKNRPTGYIQEREDRKSDGPTGYIQERKDKKSDGPTGYIQERKDKKSDSPTGYIQERGDKKSDSPAGYIQERGDKKSDPPTGFAKELEVRESDRPTGHKEEQRESFKSYSKAPVDYEKETNVYVYQPGPDDKAREPTFVREDKTQQEPLHSFENEEGNDQEGKHIHSNKPDDQERPTSDKSDEVTGDETRYQAPKKDYDVKQPKEDSEEDIDDQ